MNVRFDQKQKKEPLRKMVKTAAQRFFCVMDRTAAEWDSVSHAARRRRRILPGRILSSSVVMEDRQLGRWAGHPLSLQNKDCSPRCCNIC